MQFNSWRVFDTPKLTLPMAVAFHPKYAPDGSTWNRRGTPSPSIPATRRETPKGRTPPDWVYSCITLAVDLTSCPTGLTSLYSRKYAWADLRALRTAVTFVVFPPSLVNYRSQSKRVDTKPSNDI